MRAALACEEQPKVILFVSCANETLGVKRNQIVFKTCGQFVHIAHSVLAVYEVLNLNHHFISGSV